MLKHIGALSVFLVLCVHPLALAHEDKPHIMGTVMALDAQHMMVKTKQGETISVRLNSETKYRRGKATATGVDLQVGDRVVVDATGEGNTLTASEIRFSSSDEAKGNEETSHHSMGKDGER